MLFNKYKLEDITDKIGDGIHGTPKYDQNGEYYFINGNNLLNGEIVFKSDTKKINEEEYLKNKRELNENTILLSINGTLGNVARYKNENIILGKSACYINLKKEINADYVYFVFESPDFRKYLQYGANGTTIKNVPLSAIRNYEISIPDKSSQDKIVKILKSIEEKIKLNEKTIDSLNNIGIMLVKNCESQSDNRIEIGDIMSFTNGFAFKNSDYVEDGKYKIITIKNVQDGYIDSVKTDTISQIPIKMKDNCNLKIGDVLLSLTGNVGRVGIVYEEDMLLNQRVAKIETENKQLLPYLYFKFLMPSMREKLENISKGTAQQNLSPVETLKLHIKFDEEIVSQFLPILNSIFYKSINIRIENKKLMELKDNLLPKLIKGQINLDNLDI